MRFRDLLREIRKTHKITQSWKKTGQVYGVNKGTIYQIAKKGYIPSDPDLRLKLGLSWYRCPKCHRLIRPPKKVIDLWDPENKIS